MVTAEVRNAEFSLQVDYDTANTLQLQAAIEQMNFILERKLKNLRKFKSRMTEIQNKNASNFQELAEFKIYNQKYNIENNTVTEYHKCYQKIKLKLEESGIIINDPHLYEIFNGNNIGGFSLFVLYYKITYY